VENPEAALPLDTPPPTAAAVARPLRVARWAALLQAFSVCGIPSQLIIATVLMLGVNMQPFEGTGLSLEFFATLSLLDTALVALLIRVFLELSGESSRDVFLGRRPVLGEALRGLALLPVVFVAVTGIVLGLRAVAPSLHSVQQSPLESFMRSPLESAIFLVVVVLAGGVREELQRAFILHRFDQSLGGVQVGLGVFSLTFAALHIDQGYDVALAIGTLGLLWGIIYAKRRSAVMPMVNHACFNAAQVAQQVIARSLGA
jgi:membrane protease YdiL (CAAX protease family)